MTKNARVGPWSRTDLDSFFELPTRVNHVRESTAPINALMRIARKDELDEQVMSELLVRYESHPIIRELDSRATFNGVRGAFLRAARSAVTARPTSRASRKEAILEFYYGVVLHSAGIYSAKSAVDAKSYGPTNENRASARKHIAALLRLERRGAFDYVSNDIGFQQMLAAVDASLESTTRKKRSKRSPKLQWVYRFAFAMEVNGASSSRLVTEFASLHEEHIDSTTARRYCREAKQELAALIDRRLTTS